MKNKLLLLVVALLAGGCGFASPFTGGTPPPNPTTLPEKLLGLSLGVATIVSVCGVFLGIGLLVWGKSTAINPMVLIMLSLMSLGASIFLGKHMFLIEVVAIGSILTAITWEVLTHWKQIRAGALQIQSAVETSTNSNVVK